MGDADKLNGTQDLRCELLHGRLRDDILERVDETFSRATAAAASAEREATGARSAAERAVEKVAELSDSVRALGKRFESMFDELRDVQLKSALDAVQRERERAESAEAKLARAPMVSSEDSGASSVPAGNVLLTKKQALLVIAAAVGSGGALSQLVELIGKMIGE